jgi:hypothetical protein
MSVKDRKILISLLIVAFIGLGAVFATIILYLFFARVEMIPIYWFMLGLSIAIIGGIGAAALFIARSLPPADAPPLRLRFTPDRLGHAGFATLLIAGTGSVTAAGLGQPAWFFGAAVLSAVYAGAVFAARDKRERPD